MTQIRSIRGFVTPALGLALAAGLTFGAVACSSSPAEGSASTASVVQSVDAPLNADPTTGNDPADQPANTAADPTGAPAATGTPTYAGDTTIPEQPESDSAPTVSTAGPIAPAGNIDEIVPEVAATTAPQVALTDTADFGDKVTATVAEVKPVQATATLPGEVGGPAIAVTVKVANGSNAIIGLDSVTVTVTDAASTPASPISDHSAGALHGALAAGDAATGTYLFSIAPDQRDPVTVTVNYSAGAPTLVFTGAVAGG